jgi:hypothetical protein
MLLNLLINLVMYIQPKTKDGQTFIEPSHLKMLAGLPLHEAKPEKSQKSTVKCKIHIACFSSQKPKTTAPKPARNLLKAV